jgi:aminoglycoside phosphotransferase (APT) family kinase protein
VVPPAGARARGPARYGDRAAGRASTASPAQWAAAGAAVRRLHDAPLPPWRSRKLDRSDDDRAAELDGECAWLVEHDVLPADLVTRGRRVAEAALRAYDPVFVHGDLQVAHVFVEGDEVTGLIDWSEAGRGDGLFDLAVLTMGHPEHLDDVLAGYGTDVDLAVLRGWWALRSLVAIRWLVEHGYDPAAPGCEIDVVRSLV